MKQNYFKLLFAVLLLLCATVANANDFEVDGIFYNITDEENKTVEVTFKGSSYNEHSNEYTGNVTIPETVTYNGMDYIVTGIGTMAVGYCSTLESVEIPHTVTSIEGSAFRYCTSLVKSSNVNLACIFQGIPIFD